MDWKDLARKLGLNPTQLEWRWRNYRNAVQQSAQRAQMREQEAQYRHKVCQGCGSILDHDDLYCPRCSTPAPSWASEQARKKAPAAGFRFDVTGLIIIALGINFVIGILAFGGSNILHPTGASLISQGAMFPPLVRYGQWWRLISAGYLHIGLLHIALNCVAIWQLGSVIEPEIGGARYFVLYSLCLIGGSLLDLLFSKSVSAGASGAGFGLIGFGISYAHLKGATTARNYYLQWAAYGVVYGFLLPVDNWAHGGGCLTGLALGALIFAEGGYRKQLDSLWMALAIACLGVTLVAMGLMGRNVLAMKWLQTAESQIKSDHPEDARKTLDKIIKLDPRNADAWFKRGLADDTLGDYQAAIDDNTHFLTLNPEEPAAYNNRSIAEMQLKQYDKAIADTQKALQYGEPSAELYDRLGDCYVLANNDDGAIDAFTKAIELKPGVKELYYKRGNCEMAKGRVGAARADWTQAAKLGSNEAMQMLQLLQKKQLNQ